MFALLTNIKGNIDSYIIVYNKQKKFMTFFKNENKNEKF